MTYRNASENVQIRYVETENEIVPRLRSGTDWEIEIIEK